MTLRIRPMSESDADYEATADIWTANWPEYPKTAEMYRYSAKERKENSIFGRLVAEDDSGIVATGYFREESDNAAEGKFLLYAQVRPDLHSQTASGSSPGRATRISSTAARTSCSGVGVVAHPAAARTSPRRRAPTALTMIPPPLPRDCSGPRGAPGCSRS